MMKSFILVIFLLISVRALAQDEEAINAPAGKTNSILLHTSREPLFVIDGLIKQNRDSVENKKLLLELNPDKIERVEVLKGETATLLYGDAGKNGVVVITTKEFAKKYKKG